MTQDMSNTASVPCAPAASMPLSIQARSALLDNASGMAAVAAAMIRLGAEDVQGLRDSEAELMDICDSLLEGWPSQFLPRASSRSDAFRYVIACTARRATPPIRLELRLFVRLVGPRRRTHGAGL